jgi:ubiquinol-cytochrome c reductase cytochrome b subunit
MKTIKRSTNIIKKTYEGLGNYLSPSNFTYLWSLGSMALICLLIQILSGLFISMFYKADINMAFTSVEYINRELYYGWLVRYIHMNGASIFFLVVYLHMSKHILYGSYSYPRQVLWFSGMIIFILMMATAFMGYVLPWGQMSLWGATVITNIFSAIPVIGIDFVYWLWGGLSVENATLSRFYSLHFIFPFIILAMSIIHLVFLHEFGSNNPLGVIYRTDNIPFYINYIIKDLYSWIVLLLFFSFFVFFNVNYFGHPDNYIAGDFMVTPTKIVPEWYFLPLYAILRSVPSKLGGLVVLGLAFICFLFWPLFIGVFQLVRNSLFKPFLKFIIPLFYFNLLFLGWIGGQSAEPLYLFLGQLSLSVYFLFFFFFVFFNIIEFYFIFIYSLLTSRNN